MPSCGVCGQFISYDDLIAGKAKIIPVTPNSELTQEEFEITCEKHPHIEVEQSNENT